MGVKGMVRPSEIFLGFARYYNSLTIAFEESLATNTSRIISYMDNLGRMLGYRIFSELTFSKLFDLAGKKCPSELKGKKPDICWGYITEDGKFRYELVLESEQSMDDEKIKKDMEKLLCFPSQLKVLYCPHNNPKRVIEIAKEVAKKQQKLTGELLVIIDPWVNRKTFSKGKLLGLLLNSNLEWLAVGEANITTLKEFAHTIRLFKNATWKTVNEQII